MAMRKEADLIKEEEREREIQKKEGKITVKYLKKSPGIILFISQ